MIWQEFLVDTTLTDAEVRDGLGQLFQVPHQNILVTDDIAEVEVTTQVQILCEITPVSGDFSLKVSVYLRDPDLEQYGNELNIKQLCGILRCKCLLPDTSPNPYSWHLIEGLDNEWQVYLDPIKLDENEEYCIQNL